MPYTDDWNKAMRHERRFAAIALTAALGLAGCASSVVPGKSGTVSVPAVASPSGQVMGGQQPVAGVSLQLYVVGSSGYGSAATPLFTPGSVLTTSSGNFTFPTINCPSSSALTYLVGTGGTPIGGSQNNNLALMVGLGACGNVANAFININELTTVATVYALSGFMTGPTNIGAPASNLAGLTNAFTAINKVVNTATGAVSGPLLPASATLPSTEINALGDILQNCVNSAGGSASDTTDGLTNGTPCGKLFYLTTTTSAPTDTITATMNIAQHPSVNVAKLNDLQASSPAFSPALSVNSPPSAWTIAITYTGGGLSTPRGVAADSAGNIWVANSGNSSVSKFSSAGAAQSGSTGFTAGGISVPYALAIDQSNNVWIANSGNNTITELPSSGASGTAYSGNGLSTPKGIAIDGSGDVWVSNSASSTISAFNNSGAPLTSSPYSGGGINTPVPIAINPK